MKNKIYLITYYIIFISLILLSIIDFPMIISNQDNILLNDNYIIIILYTINIIITILFTVLLLIKRNINISKKDIYLNGIFILFTIIISLIAFLMNNYVIYPMIHIEYYFKIILIPCTLINIYSLFNFNSKKNIKK